MYSVPWHMAGTASFWVAILATPLLVMIVDFLVAYVWLQLFPSRTDLILEKQRLGRLQDLAEENPEEFSSKAEASSSTGSSSKKYHSSFVFDHPCETPRTNLGTLHPTAGDTSLVDTLDGDAGLQPSLIGQPEAPEQFTTCTQPDESANESEELPTITPAPKKPKYRRMPSAFGQQRLRSWQLVLTWKSWS
jgi:hypothetical protein